MSKTEIEEEPEITAETEAELEVESIEKVGGEDKEIIEDLECDEQKWERERKERKRRNKVIKEKIEKFEKEERKHWMEY